MENSLRSLKSGKWLKSPIFWARFLAYAIPLAFLLYVLYQNFLPFGYDKTFTIDVGGPDDTAVGEFYLAPSKDLSEREATLENGLYRELSGTAYAVFKPKAILKKAAITVSVQGNGVFIIPPTINFDPSTITDWDYAWDFSTSTPAELKGNAFHFDKGLYFDGRSRMELPDTANRFENRAFSIYAEWQPDDNATNTQQIIGHYNWELWQNKDSVVFQIGRMNDTKGPSYSIKYPITTPADFFNKRHSVLAIYNPASPDSPNGYFELFVDNIFAGRTYFGQDKIWTGYGVENLSLGWTPHNYQKSPHFTGYIYAVNTVSRNILQPQSELSLNVTNSDPLTITLISSATSSTSPSTATSTLKRLTLHVSQK